MKIKSVLVAEAYELNNINAVIQMLEDFTPAEESLINEAFENYGVATVSAIYEGLIYLRNLIEVEENKCQTMF